MRVVVRGRARSWRPAGRRRRPVRGRSV